MIIAAGRLEKPQIYENPYVREVHRYRPLTAEEEYNIIQIIQRKKNTPEYEKAREQLVLHNLRLVFSIAKKYANCGLPITDLIEEGILGLLKAVEKFSPDENCRFSTYASWWIKQGIRFALTNHIKNIRIPIYLVETIIAWKRAANILANELQRTPTQEDIADYLALEPQKLNLVRHALNAVSNPNAYMNIDNYQCIQMLVEENENNLPQQRFMNANKIEQLFFMLDKIGDREAKVLRWRYGFDDGRAQTLGEIAARLNLSRERVRQIESSAIKKLKKMALQTQKSAKYAIAVS